MTEFVANHAWIGGVFASGYLIRWAHTLWDQWREQRRQQHKYQLRQRDQAEVTRILTGLDVDVTKVNNYTVTRSPLARDYTWDDLDKEDHLPATAWERAVMPRNDDEQAWLNGPRRSLREWWHDWWLLTTPRTPEQVALEVYEKAVLAGGEVYVGHHRADGYTPHQVECLNTHTSEFPSLRHLRTGWRTTQSPVPAEVLT